MAVYNYFVLIVLAGLCDFHAGIPLPAKTEESLMKLSRLPRGSGLCPKGMSQENCFYSQLNMFMQIHDSMMDPVSLRNIGKRNGGQGAGKESISKPFMDSFFNMDRSLEDGIQNPMEDTRIPQNFYDNLETEERMSLPQLLQTFDKRFNEQDNMKADTGSNPGQMDLLPVQAKRHIICPASMSRIECYDQALAFYMRLMRSVGKQ